MTIGSASVNADGMSKKQKGELEFARLMFARRTFLNVATTCKYVKDNNVFKTSEVYHVIAAGIVTTYARPFMGSEGLGPLSRKYHEFEGEPDLEFTHEDLMKARNSLYAHFSPSEAASLLPPDYAIAQKCKVTFKGGEMLHVNVPITGWAPSRLQAVFHLCLFQAKRILSDARKLLTHMKGDDVYPDGEYVLGVEFPKHGDEEG